MLVANPPCMQLFCSDIASATLHMTHTPRSLGTGRACVHDLTACTHCLCHPAFLLMHCQGISSIIVCSPRICLILPPGNAYAQPHPPALQYTADVNCCTDGSKPGTSISSAWVHPAGGASGALALPGPSSPQGTSFKDCSLASMQAYILLASLRTRICTL